ncbi:methyltransferase type 11 [Streptomyces caatingaensis]|uniref:Methyltransferase type 11 n=2 Tax=Streptomyces caatingaensis TaxID=1678637 RepID=A0A0K9XAU7_9ACTN|nr:methyltransferase type 11 [Streptomyces caatingaensis]
MAESFGSDAERYDRARPRYPDALIERIVAGSPGPAVLDVGCGTGIAARQFRAAGCTVLGVDADARMAAFARRAGLETEVAPFETWDARGRVFDAVVAAQTWHWIDPVAGAARAAAVLRPGGRLAALWNVFRPSPRVAEAFAAVHRRVVPDAPLNPWTATAPDALLDRAADGMRRAGAFGAPERWCVPWERPYTRAQWLDQLPTSGLTARLSPAALEELLAATGAAVDAMGGSFTMRYEAIAVTAVRTGAP